MNAVEIEEAVTVLVENPFDAAEFPYQFLGWPVLSFEEYQRLKSSKDKNLTKSNTARPTSTEEN